MALVGDHQAPAFPLLPVLGPKLGATMEPLTPKYNALSSFTHAEQEQLQGSRA